MTSETALFVFNGATLSFFLLACFVPRGIPVWAWFLLLGSLFGTGAIPSAWESNSRYLACGDFCVGIPARGPCIERCMTGDVRP